MEKNAQKAIMLARLLDRSSEYFLTVESATESLGRRCWAWSSRSFKAMRAGLPQRTTRKRRSRDGRIRTFGLRLPKAAL